MNDGSRSSLARVVTAERTVDASAGRVWATLSDFGAIESWSPVVLRSFSTGAAKGGMGATRHCDLFPRGTVEEEVIEWEPDRRLAVSAEPAGGPIAEQSADFRIAPADNQSRVTMTIRFAVGEAAAGRLDGIEAAVQGAAAATVAGLKYHVETGNLVGTEVPSPD